MGVDDLMNQIDRRCLSIGSRDPNDKKIFRRMSIHEIGKLPIESFPCDIDETFFEKGIEFIIHQDFFEQSFHIIRNNDKKSPKLYDF